MGGGWVERGLVVSGSGGVSYSRKLERVAGKPSRLEGQSLRIVNEPIKSVSEYEQLAVPLPSPPLAGWIIKFGSSTSLLDGLIIPHILTDIDPPTRVCFGGGVLRSVTRLPCSGCSGSLWCNVQRFFLFSSQIGVYLL